VIILLWTRAIESLPKGQLWEDYSR